VDVIHRGYPDKFFLIAIPFGALWAALASAAVGGVLRLLGYHSMPAVERAHDGNSASNGEL